MQVIRTWGPKVRVFGLLLLSLAYVAWSYTPELGGFGGDNAIYLLSAEYLSPFRPGSALSASYFATSQYPPLFPLVLGLFGANGDLIVAHLIVTSFLLAAFLVLYKWQRALEIPSWTAFALVLLFALLPGTYFQTLEILSENLYLLLSLLGLWLHQRAQRTSREGWLFGAAIAIPAAALTRTAGASLLAALVVHLVFIGRSGRRNLIAGGIALAPVALWHLWRGGGGYAASLLTTYGADPIHIFLDRLQLQATALWFGWVENFMLAPPFALLVAVTAFGVICLAGTVVRAYRGSLDGLYVSLYLLLMLIWPFPGESQRFVFPILPILMVQGLWLLHKVPRLGFESKRLSLAPAVALTSLALVAIPQLLVHIDRFATPVTAPLSPFKHTASWYHPDPNIAVYQVHHAAQLVAALRTAGAIVPPNECILGIKPSIVSLYTKRVSKSPPAAALPLADFNRELEQRGCSYLFLVAFSSPTFNEPFYPLARLGGRAVVLLETRIAGQDSPLVAMLAKVAAPREQARDK